MQRFLLVQLKRLGDLILTAPAVAALRRAVPDAEIVMLTTRSAAELARCIRGVDRVITYHRGAANLEAWTSTIAGSWQACLDFTGTDRSALLTSFTKAKERIGYARFAENRLRRKAYTRLCEAKVRDLHTVEFHLALVNELCGIADCGLRIDSGLRPRPAGSLQLSVSLRSAADCLVIPPDVRERVKQKLEAQGISGSYAIVHPGTAKEEKAWQAARWAEVMDRVSSEFALPVVLTGSGDGWEHAHLLDIRKRVKAPVVDLSNQLSLAELAALIQECSLMVGVDSMAMHLAAMFERPQVALFGPTNPFHWRPRHDRALVLGSDSPLPLHEFDPRMKKGDVKHISTDAVIGAIRNIVRHH